jgi:translation initiation factor 5
MGKLPSSLQKNNKIPIAGLNDIDDPFYRYQRNQIVVNQLRNKSDIANFSQVALDIEREAWMLEEYTKKKFGTSLVIKNGTCSTTKIIQKDEVEMMIKEFIEYFVLCPTCRLPETTYQIEDDQYVMSCRACSAVSRLKKLGDKTANRVLECIIKNGKHNIK